LHPESKAHWEKMLLGFSILQWEMRNMEEKCQAVDFGFEPFLEKAEWVRVIEEKHFCCFVSHI
jgi:hypothetical protein